MGGGGKGEYSAQQVGLDVKMLQSMEQTDLKDGGFKTKHERMKKRNEKNSLTSGGSSEMSFRQTDK